MNFSPKKRSAIFLHGLDSSSKGTKARWFAEQFPTMLIPDFIGPLKERMDQLATVLKDRDKLVLIGSSFGGLMATLYAQQNEEKVLQVILLAPGLNFPEFEFQRKQKLSLPAQLYVGRQDTVCPPEIVVPVAEQVFQDLTVHLADDDHLLRNTFSQIDWSSILFDVS